MISKSSYLYINYKKYTVLKQVDNKFLLELEGIEYKLIVGNINNNKAFGVLYTGKDKENVIVQTKKEFKYIGDIMKEKEKEKKNENWTFRNN